MKIDMVSVPFAGHLYPLLDLARYAHKSGVATVRILSTSTAREAVDAHQLPFVKLLPNQGQKVVEIAETMSRVGSHPLRLLGQLKKNIALLANVRTQLTDLWEKEPPDLVVADFVAPIAGIVARESKIRWWTSMPTPCALETRSGVPSYLGGWKPRQDFYGNIRNWCGRKLIRTFKSACVLRLRKELKQIGFGGLYREDGQEAIYSPELILGLGIAPFEFNHDWPANFKFIGPVTGCPPFDYHKPLFVSGKKHILVTLGTHLWWAKGSVIENLRKLAPRMPDCVFHFTQGRLIGEMPTIEGNWHQYDMLPYDAYIQRYDAAIVHGGTGIVYSCLSSAVPMLVWPQDYDQFDHAARIVANGLGLKCRPDILHIETDLRKLLTHGPIRRSLVGFRKQLTAYNPHDTFVRLIGKLEGL